MGLAHLDFADRLQPRQDRRAIHLDRLFNTSFPTGQANLTATSDPYSANTSHKIALSREPHIVFGRVIEGIAYAKAYRVQLDRGAGVIICHDMASTSLGVWGARQLNTYVSGTGVWVLLPPHASHGMILGSAPDWMISADQALSDFIVQGSRVGLVTDVVHKFPFSLNSGGGIADWSSGRPFDSIQSGEWGATTDTGLMIMLDPFMMQFRVDEETGIFGFYDDQLLRVAGHNLEIRSSGYERTDDDDQDEYDSEEGWCPGYVWESLGSFKPGNEVYRELGPEDVQLLRPWYSRYEPFVDEQQPIKRTRLFHGYLGQSHKKTLFTIPVTLPSVKPPPPPPSGSDDPALPGPQNLETYPNKTLYPGLAEENWSLDGSLGIRSAKSIILSKRILIPEPKRIAHAEDSKADNANNYKFNGNEGNGVAHKIGDIADGSVTGEDPGDDKGEIRCAAFLDYYAHCFNWKGLHPFHYHKLDWYMPNESEYSFAGSMSGGNPTFETLKGLDEMTIQAPSPVKLYVDHRYGFVNYYPNNSQLALLESGEVILGDGYGSELRMVGGYIFMTAPGGIYMLPGQDFDVWAGRNATIRGYDSCEIVANRNSVFIKGDDKVMIMGGNNKCGGVLIESRSPGIDFEAATYVQDPGLDPNATEPNDVANEIIGGIILRAPRSAVFAYAKVIDLTTSHDGIGGGIVLNANKSGVIIEQAASCIRHIKTDAVDYFWNLNQADFIKTCDFSAGDVSAVGDATEWNGPPDSMDYIITCIWPSTVGGDPDLPAARINVFSSAGDDSQTSIVPGPSGTQTYIGRRGFKVTFIGTDMRIGDSWCFHLCQDPPPKCSTDLCSMNAYSCDGAVIGSPFYVMDKSFFMKCVEINDDMSASGMVAGSNFAKIDPADLVTFATTAANTTTMYDILASSAAASRYNLFQLQYTTDVIFLEFFFRSTYQDCIFDYEIFESHWHQMARNQGSSVGGWTEHAVVGMIPEGAMRGIPSYPHPGKKAWKKDTNYVKEELNMFQLNLNYSKDRGSVYEVPGYEDPTRYTLDGNFIIIDP
jgi:hypothetical protein